MQWYSFTYADCAAAFSCDSALLVLIPYFLHGGFNLGFSRNVYQFRRQLFYLGEFAQRPQKLTQIHFLLLSTFQLSLPLLHRCSQILLLFFIAGGHLDEALIRDFAADICLEQFFDSLVDLSDTLLAIVNGLPGAFKFI